MKKKINFLFIFLLAALIVLALARNSIQKNSSISISSDEVKIEESQKKEIWVGQNKITAEIADDAEKRTKGLSGRDLLGEEEGMLFVFEEPGFYSFWMKDMKFALDFVWILDDEIVDITEKVQPPHDLFENLPVYQPRQVIDKILEVNAGWVKKHGVKTGDKIEIRN